MTYILSLLCLFISMTLVSVAPASASDTIAGTMKGNAELASFYKAMEGTGVLSEIGNNGNYMVFAPVSSQFEKLVPSPEDCLANSDCKQALTSLMRNHIVNRVVNLKDVLRSKAGIFSINGHFIPLVNVGAGRYTVEGQNILETESLDNGRLYITDGVLVGDYERSLIVAYSQASEPTVKKSVETTKTTIPDPACGDEGCPDTKTTVTTIKKTITEVRP